MFVGIRWFSGIIQYKFWRGKSLLWFVDLYFQYYRIFESGGEEVVKIIFKIYCKNEMILQYYVLQYDFNLINVFLEYKLKFVNSFVFFNIWNCFLFFGI